MGTRSESGQDKTLRSKETGSISRLHTLQNAKTEHGFTKEMAYLRMSGQGTFDRIRAHRLGMMEEGEI